MNRIRFSHFFLVFFISSSIAAVWLATKAQYFDDTYTGHVVINGVETDFPAKVRIGMERFAKAPSVDFRVTPDDTEAALAKGVNADYVSGSTTCAVTGYDDKRNDSNHIAVVAVQFEPYKATKNCANAVFKVDSFTKMTVIINPDRPKQRLEMVVEREYMRNPIILAKEYISYVLGSRAMSFY